MSEDAPNLTSDVLSKAFEFQAADDARKAGVYPYFKPFDYNDGPESVIDGKRVTMFGSNNYLGLTTHPKVREAAVAAIARFGTSMTGSRFVNGSMMLHGEFEEKIASYYGRESALVFTTGYQVNLALGSALLGGGEERRRGRSQCACIDLRRCTAGPGGRRADGSVQAQRGGVFGPSALEAQRR